MTDDPAGTNATAMSASIIRRAAVVMAVAVWVAHALGVWLVWKKPLSESIESGLCAAIAGWVCWFAYHRVSRRNDGLISGVFGGLIFDKGIALPLYPSLIGGLLWAAVIGGFIGIGVRGVCGTGPSPAPTVDPVDSAEGEAITGPVPPNVCP